MSNNVYGLAGNLKTQISDLENDASTFLKDVKSAQVKMLKLLLPYLSRYKQIIRYYFHPISALFDRMYPILRSQIS